ncbi:MAG: ABC transporter permease [Burkholderiaceae bacterium]
MNRLSLWAFSILVLVFLLAPILIVILMSFSASASLEFPPRGLSLQWYAKYFSSAAWLGATWVSFKVALGTTALATVLGTLASFGLVRGNFPGKPLLYALVLSPLVIPGVVVAVALYLLFGRLGLVGSPFGLVLAHTTIALPFVIVNVSISLKTFDRNIERAAMSAGADPLRTFRYVTLPLIRPGFVAGALFAFMASFDELIIAIFLAGRNATTLPKRMWDSVLLETDPVIAAISTLLIVGTLIFLALATGVRQRGSAAADSNA